MVVSASSSCGLLPLNGPQAFKSHDDDDDDDDNEVEEEEER